MRILSLRLANINSLAGEWSINFEDPIYRDGLFALTGPTGSGKTSVLDALSLALYGRTVRQKISKETNEVMTRGTGFALSEVTFETKGRRYLCAWSQHRARSKPNGTLQAAKRSLTCLTDSATLCERLADMDEAVTQVTGMTFGQFTRSVLLAQGQFDAFLKAKDDERSDILEQVTGTEIYSEVGAAAFARYQLEKRNKEELEQRQSAIQVLDADGRCALLQKRDAAWTLKQALEAATSRLQNECAWLESLSVLRARFTTLLDEQAAYAARQQAAQAALDQLTRAEAARSFDTAYARLTAARQTASQRAEDVCARTESLKLHQAQYDDLVPQVGLASDLARQAQETLGKAIPLLMQVRGLDQQRAVAASELKAAERALAEALHQQKTAQTEIGDRETKLTAWRDERETALRLRSIRESMPLTAALDQRPLVKAVLEWREVTHAYETALPALETLLGKRDQTGQEKTRAELEQTLRRPDLETARDRSRDKVALIARMANLDEQRTLLKEGEHCPLCGATSHPFATGGPLPKIAEAQAQLQDIEQKIKRLELNAADARAAAEKAESAFRQQETVIQTCKQAIILAQNRFEVAQTELDSRIAAGAAAHAQQLARLETLAETVRQRAEAQQLSEKTLAALAAKRQALFAGHPDAEEKRLRQAAEKTREHSDGLRMRLEQLKATLQNDTLEVAKAERLRDESARQALAITAELTAQWVSAGFTDEAHWHEARWTDDKLEQTKRLKEALSAAGNALRGRLADCETALRQKEAQAVTDRPLDEVTSEWTAKRQELEAQMQHVADLQAILKADDEALIRRRGQGEALERQKARFAKWEVLNGWIGGENGARFKRYAQGITLRRLLQVANPHLARMTRDRYEMFWNPESQELVPEMIDREQGDVRRAVSNLSGGETFLVSLALALGLSNMASGRLRVDSLFLDEGFGSLDEDALDSALDTLAGLQQQGKLIGIISHVPAIKERIRTQIQIQPQAGGRSVLRGAGVLFVPAEMRQSP